MIENNLKSTVKRLNMWFYCTPKVFFPDFFFKFFLTRSESSEFSKTLKKVNVFFPDGISWPNNHGRQTEMGFLHSLAVILILKFRSNRL